MTLFTQEHPDGPRELLVPNAIRLSEPLFQPPPNDMRVSYQRFTRVKGYAEYAIEGIPSKKVYDPSRGGIIHIFTSYRCEECKTTFIASTHAQLAHTCREQEEQRIAA